jgi:hypothetical protein
MTRWATLLALLAAPCRPEAPQSPPKETSQSAPAGSCLDRQLAAKGLNPFGDPAGTMYAGGTPLFDEKTGRSTPRDQYVFAKHADIARACAADAGP